MKTVLHIAPQLPPAVDGVGDYCWHLWQHWPDSSERWQFGVRQNAEMTRQAYPELPVHSFNGNAASLRDVLRASRATHVVLHYVGYGYQPKGIPVWMPVALEHWRRAASGQLVTMFHEMYADSTPFRSPFWVKPWARQIIRRLVSLSDAWVTSCPRYFRWLVEEFGANPDCGRQIPIGSNVPPAAELPETRLWPLEFGRKLRVVVFGLPNTRLRALERHRALAGALVRAGLVESFVLLGQSCDSSRRASACRSLQQEICGTWQSISDLPSAQLAQTLADCDLGLVANDPGTLTKSGVFAALATNGVIPVVSNRDGYHVPAPFNGCVLLNDDLPPSIEALANELRGSNRMKARRRATLAAASSELAWPRVAEAFHAFVNTLGADSAAPSAQLEPSTPEMESRAPIPLHKEVRA